MKIAIYVCVNKKFIPLLMLFLDSFKMNANIKVDYDFYCFVDNMNIVTPDLVKRYHWVRFEQTTTTQLSNYTEWHNLFFYGMSMKIFALEKLYDSYDRIIYFDVDIIINGDLNSLITYDLVGNSIAAVPDFQKHRRNSDMISDNHITHVIEYRKKIIDNTDQYFNSGMYIIDNPLSILNTPYDDFAKEFRPTLVDQDYLNYVYKNDVLILPDCWNYMCDNAYTSFMSYQERINDSIAMGNAMVQHFHGGSKPWKAPNTSWYFELLTQMNTNMFFVIYDGLLDHFLSKSEFKWLVDSIAVNRPLLQKTDELANKYSQYIK